MPNASKALPAVVFLTCSIVPVFTWAFRSLELDSSESKNDSGEAIVENESFFCYMDETRGRAVSS